PLPAPPNLIGLAARGGTIYGVTDTMLEDDALVLSTDEGQSWQPFMRYADIQAIDACARTQCQADCQMRADIDQWPAEMCAATPQPRPVDDADAGADGDAAPGDGADASDGGGAISGSGCRCAASGAGGSGATPWAVLTVA